MNLLHLLAGLFRSVIRTGYLLPIRLYVVEMVLQYLDTVCLLDSAIDGERTAGPVSDVPHHFIHIYGGISGHFKQLFHALSALVFGPWGGLLTRSGQWKPQCDARQGQSICSQSYTIHNPPYTIMT